jgi:hypothetical protein
VSGEGQSQATSGLQRPGDLTGDGAVDISDAIAILSFLFLGGERTPCSAALADFNGDGSVDISDSVASLGWLFLGGAPHALGEACVPLAGCSEACIDG